MPKRSFQPPTSTSPPSRRRNDAPSDSEESSASSSSEEGDSAEEQEEESGDEGEEEEDAEAAGGTNFEDLPTDDSEDDSDSDSDDSDSDSASVTLVNPNLATNNSNSAIYLSSNPDEDGDLSMAEKVTRNSEMGRIRREDRDDEGGASEKSSFKRKLEEMKAKKSSGTSSGGEKKKKRSKHAPTEQSSSRKTFFQVGAPTLNSRGGAGVKSTFHTSGPSVDPRFSSLSGNLDQRGFEQGYKFLEEVEAKEIASLKERQKAVGVHGKKGQKMRKKLGLNLENASEEKEQLSKLLMQRGERNKAQIDRDSKTAVKRSIAAKVAEGANPFFLKKREMKEKAAEARYDELKKRGGNRAVKKDLEKRRKKNSQKDKKMLPSRS